MEKDKAILEFKEYCESFSESKRIGRQEQIRNSFDKSIMDVTVCILYENNTWKKFGIRIGEYNTTPFSSIKTPIITIFDEGDRTNQYALDEKEYLELKSIFYNGTGYAPNHFS